MMTSGEYAKSLYVKKEKEKLILELARYDQRKVSALLFTYTGRDDLSTANLFCLALMANALRPNILKFRLTEIK
jgi:hypothetical protein